MARTVVGLDIGSSGVRAAEFVQKGPRVTLRRFASRPLAPGVVRGGTVFDEDALAEAIRALWSDGKFRSRKVVIGIANAGVLVRQMDLDWMPPADFRNALRFLVEDALPFPVDGANLDYHLLEELEVTAEGAAPRRVARILLVAATREMVDSFVHTAERAGLRPDRVDLLPFALLRCRSPRGLDAQGEVEAVVDIGADVVTVVVHAGGVPRYVRMIPGVGGDSITRALQERHGWTWDEAERTKVTLGLPGYAQLDDGQSEPVAARPDGLDHPAQRVIVTATDALVEEISTTLDYYRSSAAEEAASDAASGDVRRILLAGSAALLGGLPQLLELRLDVPAELLDVRRQVKAPRRARLGREQGLALVVPAGLCAGAGR